MKKAAKDSVCGMKIDEKKTPGISQRREIMKKAIVVLAIVFLSSVAAQAQMGGGRWNDGRRWNDESRSGRGIAEISDGNFRSGNSQC